MTNTNENHWNGEPSSTFIKPIRDDLSLKLFDLKNDPGERLDIADDYPEKAAELQAAYDDWCNVNINVY